MKIFPMESLAATGEIVPAAFTVDRKPLADALALIAKAVERRNTVPILSNVLIEFDGFDTLTLTGTDLDCQVSVGMAATGRVAFATTVAAHSFQDVVKKAERDYVEATLLAGALALVSGRSRSKLPTLPANGFPTLRVKGGGASFVRRGEGLASDLGAVAPSMSTEETRYCLRGVALQARDDQMMLVATNGHTMAAVARPYDSNFPDSIIPRKTVEILIRALKGCATIIVDFSGADRQSSAGLIAVTAANGNLRIVSKLIDGDFPDYSLANAKAIGAGEPEPIAEPEFEPRLNPSYVRNMAKGVGAALTFEAGENAARVTCPDRPEFYGLICYRAVDKEAVADAPWTVTYADGDGNAATMPLGGKFEGEGAIGLTADQVAKLCGPVDPSTFVDIPRATYLHGRIIALDGIATDGTGRSVYMPDAKRMTAPKRRALDSALHYDPAALAAHVAAHLPVYLDAPDVPETTAGDVESMPAPLMITYQPGTPPVSVASACEPETAVERHDPPAPLCEPHEVVIEAAIEPGESVQPTGSVLDRLAALEKLVGLEAGTGENSAAETEPAQSFSAERRLRFIRAYLAMRAEREAGKQERAAYGAMRESYHLALARAASAESKLETMHRDLVVHTGELTERAKVADARAEAAEFKAAELADSLAAVAKVMAMHAPAIDDVIAGKVRAVEESQAIEPVEEAAEPVTSGFVITRRKAA